MTRKIGLTVFAALVLVLAIGGTLADEGERPPEFDNAPVREVLTWAQDTLGVGFIYEAEVLLKPGTSEPRRVTASHVLPELHAERTKVLFELLREAGLVPFEVGGLPGPTYRLMDAGTAARNAPIVDSPAQLEGLYYAGLTIRLQRTSVQEVATRIRGRLSPRVGTVETFEITQSLIVTDFVDRLQAAWEVARTAELAAVRDDDMVVEDFVLRNTQADRAAAALERLRERDEGWRLAMHATANVLLISGRRDEVAMVAERARLLDLREARPEYAEDTRVIGVISADPGHVARTLREMFEAQVKAGSVQIGVFDRTRAIVFRGSRYDYERALETVRVLDVAPERNND
jgi:hypothetical protein